MKGTVVAVVTGLAALVAAGAAGGALLVERTLTEEATRALAAEGVDAHVNFSGLTATVSAADPNQLPTALRLVLDVPGVVRAEADRSSLPTASTSQPTTSAPAPTKTPSPTPSPSEQFGHLGLDALGEGLRPLSVLILVHRLVVLLEVQ